jgi:hypothetical protein
MAGDNFIFTVRPLPHNSRDEDTVGFHALHRFLHFFIVPHLEGMVGKVMELGERDVDD